MRQEGGRGVRGGGGMNMTGGERGREERARKGCVREYEEEAGMSVTGRGAEEGERGREKKGVGEEGEAPGRR